MAIFSKKGYGHFAHKKNKITKQNRKIIGVFIIGLGFLILAYFFFPVISYKVFLGASMDTIEAPVPKYAIVERGELSSLITQGISNLTLDYNDVRNWSPQVQEHATNNTSVSTYLFSIPKLNIQNAEVSTVDYDLTRHLVQYAGTAIPGKNGTTVIFGHSTLPQWFDPKNYKSIFATLHTIQEGDLITAKVNGITYSYKVYSITITSPEDVNIFSQSFDQSYITLVTCTPPGTVWKRLVVRARIEDVGGKLTRGK